MAGLVMQASASASASAYALPALRPDLALMPGGPAEDGSPTWLIHDAARNRYFRLGLDAFRALSHWTAGQGVEDFQQTCARHGIDLDADDVMALVQFVHGNQLTQASGEASLKRLMDLHLKTQQHWLKWLLHHYLFVRIPLWRPDAFLDRSWPWVARLLQPKVLWTIRAMGVLGLLMVAQQWEVFQTTFLHFLSWQGLALYGVTLAVVKSAHELGHAYVAKRYGCRVGSIGVAIMLLLPVLYTDTTDAWRLRSPRDRLRIVTAGVATELHLAMLATFAWSLLPDGPLRSAAFFVATTSWVTSLLVNLSPFMRFDGYFALSDALNAENLQPRSFALARWHLREMLFGFGEPVPERLAPWRHRLFIGYAYTTWVYRLLLFVGIAVLVYNVAFKLLGILLFAVEIAWFILMPMKNEWQQWWQRRSQMRLNRRTLSSLGALILLGAAAVVPWSGTVTVPGVLLAGQFQPVFAPERGRIAELLVAPRTPVPAQAPLVRLEQPELQHALEQTQRELALVVERIERQAGSARDLQDALILAERRTELQTRIRALQQRLERMVVRAPMAGVVSQMDNLQEGQWVGETAPLLTLRSQQGLRVMGLVPAEDLGRLEDGAQATWVSDLPGSPLLKLRLLLIDQTALERMPWPELASDHGGPVPTRKDARQQLNLEGAWYQVELESSQQELAPTLQQPGKVLIQARAESLVGRYWRHFAAVWIRETGF